MFFSFLAMLYIFYYKYTTKYKKVKSWNVGIRTLIATVKVSYANQLHHIPVYSWDTRIRTLKDWLKTSNVTVTSYPMISNSMQTLCRVGPYELVTVSSRADSEIRTHEVLIGSQVQLATMRHLRYFICICI